MKTRQIQILAVYLCAVQKTKESLAQSRVYNFLLCCAVWVFSVMSLLFFLETLRNYFSQYGEVVDCVIMKDKTTNQSRGFGFVKFKDPNCVRTVLETKPHNLDGRNVSISGWLRQVKSLCFVLTVFKRLVFCLELFLERKGLSFGSSWICDWFLQTNMLLCLTGSLHKIKWVGCDVYTVCAGKTNSCI